MISWYSISALGHLSVTAPLSIAIAAWVATSQSPRRALYWCLLLGAAMLVVVASKMAFIGWGIGSREYDFTGFSGHAARAAAVFPVVGYCITRGQPALLRFLGMGVGALLAVLVSVSRVMVLTHSVTEVVLGALLGAAVALAFMALTRNMIAFRPGALLVGVTLGAMLIHPKVESISAHQILTGVTLNLSGYDREFLRWNFKRSPHRYRPPCASTDIHFNYICL